MNNESIRRAQRLEQELREVVTPEKRRELFIELCGMYAGELQADAIKWARARRLQDPISAGQEALSRAFILLVKDLDDINFEQHALNYHLKGKIWSELSHAKTRQARYEKRNQAIEDVPESSFASGDRTEERLYSREFIEKSRKFARTSAERRLVRAGQLTMEGYSWQEVAKSIGWEGSSEGLRASFSRLKKLIRERSARDE